MSLSSGTSTTQVGALADEVEYELSQKGIEPQHHRGLRLQNLVLLDYSSVIVHVFVPNTRTYDQFWNICGPMVSPWISGVSDPGKQSVSFPAGKGGCRI
ncbi:RsfS/YbeB/iojap family protein [Faecalibacterium hattorii]